MHYIIYDHLVGMMVELCSLKIHKLKPQPLGAVFGEKVIKLKWGC